jgi:alpha-1,3-rhamnosyl/mannosyltransferase
VRPGRPPLVVTVHDDLPWSHPEWMSRANVLQHRLVVERALPRAAAVLTVSEATRRALLARFALDPARVSVAPHGVDPVFTPGPAGETGVPAPYLLAVGTLQPRKGLDTALAAFERCAAAGAPHHLVVAGARGWRDDAIVARFARSPVRDRVHLLGAVPDARLVSLLRGAALLLVPSRYEGFGLPALEGMACGTPVVAADATSLPGVIGDAGELVPPGDDAAWGERIGALLADPARRASMRERGLARAATFTWARCAERTVVAYERALDVTC